MASWLDLAITYSLIPHKLVRETLERHHVPASVRDLILNYYSDFSLNLFRIHNIRVAPAGGGNHHGLYHLSDTVCSGEGHASEICRTKVQRPQV